jgi:hypothetical protein
LLHVQRTPRESTPLPLSARLLPGIFIDLVPAGGRNQG